MHAFLFRPFAVLAAALALTALAPLPAQAQQTPGDFPTRPLRIIVPFAPGGATDVLARMIGQKLTDKTKYLWYPEAVKVAAAQVYA